jgi:hypothetical protein
MFDGNLSAILVQQATQCTNSVIYFSSFALHVSGSHTPHRQEATCTVWQMVIVSLTVDCLWARMERKAHRQ